MATEESVSYLTDVVGIANTRTRTFLIGLEQMYMALSLMDEGTIEKIQAQGLENIINSYAHFERLRKIFPPSIMLRKKL